MTPEQIARMQPYMDRIRDNAATIGEIMSGLTDEEYEEFRPMIENLEPAIRKTLRGFEKHKSEPA